MKKARDERIAAEARRGMSHAQLAAKYGVTPTRIGQILQRASRREKSAMDRESVHSLGLSTRSINALTGMGITRVAELETQSRADLARTKNLGARSIQEIAEALRRRGLFLRGEGGSATRRIADVEALLRSAVEDARVLASTSPDSVRSTQLRELVISIETALRLATNLRERGPGSSSGPGSVEHSGT